MRLSAKEATQLIGAGRAPPGIETGVLDLGMRKAVQLPEGLRCFSLRLAGQPLRSLPTGLQVEYRLDLSDCSRLMELPRGLKVSTLILTNCRALKALPEALETNFLQIDGCTELSRWPEDAQVTCGWVRAQGCAALERLPQRLGPLASIDLRDCRRITSVPPGVEIRSWLDVGNTRITSLPEPLRGVALRWRGVPVTPQIAFFPETISSASILTEKNVELRRVMIERVGFEKFLREVNARVIDHDRDRGGERQLFRVPLENDEPMVIVSVRCPSTGHQYLVRVPPETRRCHQAVAWTAGFDDPNDYAPTEET